MDATGLKGAAARQGGDRSNRWQQQKDALKAYI